MSAYDQGSNAFYDYKGKCANPYKRGDSRWYEWKRGYEHAERDGPGPKPVDGDRLDAALRGVLRQGCSYEVYASDIETIITELRQMRAKIAKLEEELAKIQTGYDDDEWYPGDRRNQD
jgi:hypothetical protein